MLLMVKILIAQPITRYNSFSYNVNDGLLQSTIADIAIDKNNFCWISFPNGIQKFDGKNFIYIPVQPGLPDDKFVTFLKCNNGDLLLSHSAGISKYIIDANRLQQVYNNKSPAKNPSRFIGQDGAIIYFCTDYGSIIGLNSNDFKIISEKSINIESPATKFDNGVKFSDNIINHTVAFLMQEKLFLWDLQKGKLQATSVINSNMNIFLLRLKNKNEVLFCGNKTNNALSTYNFLSKKTSIQLLAGKSNLDYGRCCILPWGNKTLISFDNKLYETDATLQELKSELVNFQNNPIAGSGSIAKIATDNFGNLYLQTVTAGLKKLIRNNYPIKYYGTEKKEENFIISILPEKKKNRIIAGTFGYGILIFDTLQRLVKHIKTIPTTKVPFSPNQIIKVNNNKYLIFCAGEKNIWLSNEDFSKMVPITVKSELPLNKRGVSYFGNKLFTTEAGAMVQSQSMIYKVNLANYVASEHLITDHYTMSGLHFNNSIITHCNDELIFMDAASLSVTKRIAFKNTGFVRCFATDNKNQIYIGSNKGIFKMDSSGQILKQYNKQSGLADECIYAICFDKDGFLWCSTNKGILKLNAEKTLVQLSKEDGLQENEFNTNVVAKAEDGELFFGGVNGVSSFHPTSINSIADKISLLFTQIKINNKEAYTDTAAWSIKEMNLPYNQNLLAFDFIAVANNNPGQYIYQFKMEGLDKEWIRNDALQTARYFLPTGKYVFKIAASRFFNTDAKSLKEIRIIIHPPFWETKWFYIAIGLLLAGIMLYSINRIAKQKYHKKLTELENERTIQLERERISRDLHDSLGAYANAVLYNTELLEKENEFSKRNELMNDLKFASKDIITSLRETVWALKKDNYTAQECILRIKNFILPLSRYYTAIHFIIETEEAVDKLLFHSKALNVVRIVQEAVTNAIKHAAAKNISINSYLENNKWKITVTDDGKGFDYKNMKEDREGNGLYNLKQRAIDSGIELTINSAESGGTVIIITV